MRFIVSAVAVAFMSVSLTSGCSKRGPEATKEDVVGNSPPQRSINPEVAMQDANVARQPPEQAPPNEKAGVTARKLIYTAEASINVEDLDKAAAKLEQLVKDHKGYIARQNIQGSSGNVRAGSWTVRIPIDAFEAFRAAIRQLGEVTGTRIESREVTEEYVDLQARLDTKTETRLRLEQHLQNKTAKLEDIIKAEAELDRVVEELEKVKGRMRLLDDLVALTTVTVNMQELRKYTPEETPTFGTTIHRTFQNSWSLLLEFGQTLVLIVVALAPWLVILAVVALVLWSVLRRLPRQSADATRIDPRRGAP